MARQTFQKTLIALSLASTLSLTGILLPVDASGKATVEAILFNTLQKSFLIKNSGPTRATVNSFNVSGNRRVIIDIENAEIGLSMPRDGLLYRELVSRWPSVKNITINQFGGARPVVRVLLDIQGEDYMPELVQASGNTLELRLNQSTGSKPFATVTSSPPVSRQPEVSSSWKSPETQISAQPTERTSQERTPVVKTYPEDRPVYAEPKPLAQDVPHIKLVELQRTKEDLALARQKFQEQATLIQQLQSQVKDLNAQVHPTTGPSLEELKRTLIVLNQKYDDLTSENQRLKSELNNTSETLAKTPNSASLQSQIASLKKQISQNQEAIRRQEEESESVKAQLKAAKTENTKLVSELKRTERGQKEALASSGEQVALKEKLNEAKQELVQAAELIKKQNQDIKNLNEKIAKVATGENASFKEQLTYLNAKLEEKEAELQRLKTNGMGTSLPEGVTPDAAYTSLSQKYDQLIRENKTLKEKVTEAQNRPQIAAAPEGNEKIRMRALEEQLSQARSLLNNQEAQIREMRSSLKSRSTSKSSDPASRKLLEEKDRQIAELERKIISLGSSATGTPSPEVSAKYEAKLKSLEVLHKDELAHMKKEMDQQEKLMDELYAQLEQAKGVAGSKKSKMPLEKTKLVNTSNSGTDLKAERDALIQEKAMAEQAILELKEQQALSNSGIAELKTRNDSLSRQLSDLTDKYQLAISEAVTAKEQVKGLRAAKGTPKNNGLDGEMRALQTALTQKNNELQKLQSKMESLQAKAAQQSGSDHSAQLEALQSERNQLTENLTATENKLVMLQSEIDRLKSQSPMPPEVSPAENTPMRDSRQMLASAKKQIKDLEQQLALLKQGQKPESEGIDLRSVQEEKEDTAKRLASAEKQIQELKDQLRKKAIGTQGKGNIAPPQVASLSGISSESIATIESAFKEAKDAEKDGQWTQALNGYRQAYKSAPTVSKYAISLAQALVHEQQYDEAIQALETFLDQEPGNKEAYSQLGKAYLLAGRIEDANQMFATAMPTATMSNYATSLKKLGRMSEAERVLKMALEIQPNDTDLLFNLGNLYNTTNQFGLAKDTYLKALDKKPDFAEAHYNLGLLYSKTNEPKSAVTHLERYLELSPESPNKDAVKNFLKKLKA
jgi:Flp pilus assembly protein TadD